MILGIDFGTTKSVVAAVKHCKTEIIADRHGHRSIPSLVMVSPDKQLHIGWDALTHACRYQSKHFTISSIKRMMGKTHEADWGSLRTCPQEVAALILGRLKIQAELHCNAEISRAVIAVPAHFDINQRWATLQAAEIAGFKVERLLNEATAAVLSYSAAHDKVTGTILVFDFGGGTLDVSVVHFGEGLYEVLAACGDDRLGGDDFDQLVSSYLLDSATQRFGCTLEDLTPMQKLVLIEAACRAKIELSSAPTTRVYIPGFLSHGSRHLDLDVDLSRATFENLSGPLFDRAMTVVRTALKECRGESVDEVLLVGGTSRIPYFREQLSKVAKIASAGIDPGSAVAEGACIYAGVLSGQSKNVLLLDVSPSTYCVQTSGDKASNLIERNTLIPTRRSEIFTTTQDRQTEITVQVFEGENRLAIKNTYVGEVRLTDVPPAAAGVAQIEVTFDMDANAVLTVTASDLATKRQVRTSMQAPYRLNNAQIQVLRRKLRETYCGLSKHGNWKPKSGN